MPCPVWHLKFLTLSPCLLLTLSRQPWHSSFLLSPVNLSIHPPSDSFVLLYALYPPTSLSLPYPLFPPSSKQCFSNILYFCWDSCCFIFQSSFPSPLVIMCLGLPPWVEVRARLGLGSGSSIFLSSYCPSEPALLSQIQKQHLNSAIKIDNVYGVL